MKVAHADHWRVSLSGEVDTSAEADLCSLAQLLTTGGEPVDFDLRRVNFVDAGGWRAICAAADLVRSAGVTARIVNPSPAVLRLTGLLGGGPVGLAPVA